MILPFFIAAILVVEQPYWSDTWTPLEPSISVESFATLAPPTLAPAQEAEEEFPGFSYTYAELGYIWGNPDDIDDDVDAFYLEGSLSLGKLFYIFGEYQNQETDFQNTDTDLWIFGAGAHFGVMPKLDLVGEAALLFSDVSSDQNSLDDSNFGWTAFGGARWMPLLWNRGGLEVNGGINYLDLDGTVAGDSTQWGFEVGARAHFLKLLSVGATYQILEDQDGFLANVRVSF